MSAGTSVRLIGPYYQLSQQAGRFWCVSESPARMFLHPEGKLNMPRDVDGRVWGVNPTRLVYLNSEGRLILWSIEGKRSLFDGIADPKGGVEASPDGEWLTFLTKSLRMVLRSSNGELRMQTDLSVQPVFSQHTEMLAVWVENVHRVGGGCGWIRLLDLSRKAVKNIDMAHPVDKLFFLDGDELVVQTRQKELQVYSASQAEKVRANPGPGHTLVEAAGQRLIFSVDAEPGRLRLIDAQNFQVVSEVTDAKVAVLSLEGHRMAYHAVSEQTHQVRILNTKDGSEEAILEVKDPAFDEFDPDMTLQLRFQKGGNQFAALANGEELRVWGIRGQSWVTEKMTPSASEGKDTYISLDTLDRTLNVATSAIKGIGGFLSKVVKQKTDPPRSGGTPKWLNSSPLEYSGGPDGFAIPSTPEASLSWVRDRKERFKKRGPDVLPRTLKNLNNRALRARIALERLEPFLTRVEEQPPPYNLSVDEVFKLVEALRVLVEAHPKGSPILLALAAVLELLTRDHFSNRQTVSQLYVDYGFPEFAKVIAMENPDQEKARELEEAKARLVLADELELWVIPDLIEATGMEPEEAKVLEAALYQDEDMLRTACARVGDFNRKIRQERIHWLIGRVLRSGKVEVPAEIRTKLERAFKGS